MANGDVFELVPAPAVDEWDYGLFDAAVVRTAGGHWQRAGFSFETDECADGAVWEYDSCFVPTPPDATKQVEVGIDRAHSTQPITLYSGVACTPIGIGDAADRAEQRLANVVPKLFERYVWDQVLSQQATDITPEAGVGPEAGIGLLEARLRWNYAGTGILHAPSWAAELLRDMVEPTEPARTTKLGTRWAFGAGYDIDATSGQPETATTVTVYATGAVLIYRSEVFIPATARTGAFDHETNLLQVLAEQTYAIALDCAGPWAVTITLPGGGA